MTAELTCQELVELVTAYIDDALPDSERARFERHLSLCPGCDTYVEQIRETVRLTGAGATETSLPPAARDALLAQFRNWKGTQA